MSLTAVLRSFLPCFLPLTSTVSRGSKSSARLTVAPGRRRSGSPTLSIRSCRVSLIRSPLLDRRLRTGAPRTSVREHVPFRLAPHGSTHRDLASGPRSRGSTSASRSGTHRTTIRRLSHPYPQCSLNLGLSDALAAKSNGLSRRRKRAMIDPFLADYSLPP